MKQFNRILQYIAGLLILALGITLNTKTGLGVSPIISVPYGVSQIWNLNFGNATLVLYLLFIIAQFFIKGKNRTWTDLLQLPLSIVFSQLLGFLSNALLIHYDFLWKNLLLLFVAIICTGTGISLTVNTNFVVNPGDGIVQAIAMRTKMSLGFAKNFFDLGCIITTVIIGLCFQGKVIGIGIGTLAAVLGIGRVVALANYLLSKKIKIKSCIPDR